MKYDNIPMKDEVINGYDFIINYKNSELAIIPAKRATEKIEELKLTGKWLSIHSIPVDKAFEQLKIKYSIEYNQLWDIYIVEFLN